MVISKNSSGKSNYKDVNIQSFEISIFVQTNTYIYIGISITYNDYIVRHDEYLQIVLVSQNCIKNILEI